VAKAWLCDGLDDKAVVSTQEEESDRFNNCRFTEENYTPKYSRYLYCSEERRNNTVPKGLVRQSQEIEMKVTERNG
jgi:hypothetical protein